MPWVHTRSNYNCMTAQTHTLPPAVSHSWMLDVTTTALPQTPPLPNITNLYVLKIAPYSFGNISNEEGQINNLFKIVLS